ncbi:endonuclease VIII [Vallitalea pronyensis]|uniref:Endonuclease VIII n=1 Tax=Vallitalea pronyensis TaxID=1348613 RepID=A0A8J8MIZ7_9FIRM|nr:DNA-formamidopyrimidine glycosylase family protein [Vallitalea pronyensis]QUI22520.1 endonuclease VIII [Vallitalea pronyensis]
MLEIPEVIALSHQINERLVGREVTEVIANHSPHKFAWFYEDSDDYAHRLVGKVIDNAKPYGGLIEVSLGDIRIVFMDGVALRLIMKGEKLPKKHQLLIKFDDDSTLIASVQMYGGMLCFKEGTYDNMYYQVAKTKPSPLTEAFDKPYFSSLLDDPCVQKKSVKALLATEQRIPGLGNGVLQDILFNAHIHPKQKVSSLTEEEIDTLFHAIKATLHEMTMHGGRDTEKDLFGCPGGYKTKLSKIAYKEPCRACGGTIIKKAYMGGSIYYCEHCQPLD